MKFQIIDQVIAREGGFSDSAADSGGATRFGIIEKNARKHGYEGPMHSLPREKAVEIYLEDFWGDKFDEILEVSPAIVAELFDTGVNLGPARAGKFLQRSLNVLNRGGKDYADVKVDGDIGKNTVKALKAFLRIRRARGEAAMLKALNSLQGHHYISLTERRHKEEAHLFGWLGHRIVL